MTDEVTPLPAKPKRASGRARMAAKAAGESPVSVSAGERGEYEARVRAVLETLTLDAVGLARGELALSCARKLDADPGMAFAAVARECRAALDAVLASSRPKVPGKVDQIKARRDARGAGQRRNGAVS